MNAYLLPECPGVPHVVIVLLVYLNPRLHTLHLQPLSNKLQKYIHKKMRGVGVNYDHNFKVYLKVVIEVLQISLVGRQFIYADLTGLIKL